MILTLCQSNSTSRDGFYRMPKHQGKQRWGDRERGVPPGGLIENAESLRSQVKNTQQQGPGEPTKKGR